MATASAPPSTTYPVDVECEIPDGHNRLTTFFRYFLVIPHAIVLGLLAIVAFAALVVAWFAILITGRQPQGIWNFNRMFMRWVANVTAYQYLMRDEYPPFGSGDYPVQVELDYPDGQNRLTTFFRGILVIPHYIALYFIGIIWGLLTFFAWFAILFTGRYPQSFKSFAEGAFRWQMRVYCYWMLLRDEYPPFGFSR